MIHGISWNNSNLADVQRKRGHQIGHIRRTRLDHQVGRIHGAPKFSFDHEASRAWPPAQRLEYEVMGANVGLIPVVRVRQEDD